MTLTCGSLFAGIGGFDLGFERAGIRTIWQVEINEYCRRVLERHFPEAERFEDVRTVGAHNLRPADILAGGFPCQDISLAGRRAGIIGERSGLWKEYFRIIRELSPRYVVIENVSALLGNGMDVVLGDLSESGYDAEWQVISAADVGARHLRERIWIVAYPDSGRRRPNASGRHDANGTDAGRSEANGLPGTICSASRARALANADSEGLPIPRHAGTTRPGSPRIFTRAAIDGSSWWAIEPAVGRVAHGIPRRVDRLRALGNAIVPQIAEWIGRRIVEAHRDS